MGFGIFENNSPTLSTHSFDPEIEKYQSEQKELRAAQLKLFAIRKDRDMISKVFDKATEIHRYIRNEIIPYISNQATKSGKSYDEFMATPNVGVSFGLFNLIQKLKPILQSINLEEITDLSVKQSLMFAVLSLEESFNEMSLEIGENHCIALKHALKAEQQEGEKILSPNQTLKKIKGLIPYLTYVKEGALPSGIKFTASKSLEALKKEEKKVLQKIDGFSGALLTPPPTLIKADNN